MTPGLALICVGLLVGLILHAGLGVALIVVGAVLAIAGR